MAMTIGSGGPSKTPTPAMNVTPLVDVVLVLLIIFMVITPLLTKNFWIHLPKQEKEEIEKQDLPDDPDPPLVLKILPESKIQVNGVDVGYEELPERLKRMFAARDDHILFFDAADDAEYGFAVRVLDQAREGGAVTIAPLTVALSENAALGTPADAGAPPATAAP
ncbi:MAG: biopolymer transporter ExbD [bacterium]|nr:biopolymer transporter ExbD [bacterium]